MLKTNPSMPASTSAWIRLADLVRVAHGQNMLQAFRIDLQPVGPGRELLLGLLVRPGDRESPEARAGDLRRIAADVLAVGVEDAHQVSGPLGVAEDVAAVCVLRDEAEGLPLAAAADEDRDVAA